MKQRKTNEGREGRRARYGAPALPNANVTRRMLMQLGRPNSDTYSIDAPTLRASDVVIHGRLNNYRCHSGLRVHATDTLEAHDLSTEADVERELTVAVFLEGKVEMDLDGERLALGGGERSQGHIWMVGQPSRCRRISRKGTRIRKVLISAPPEWIGQLLEESRTGADAIARFLNTHRASASWTPSKRVLALCEQILSPANAPHVIQCMGIEAKAIEIFSEGLAALAGTPKPTGSPSSSVRYLSRAQRIRAYLIEHIAEDLSLRRVAKDLGLSVESMQRAFKSAYGRTIVDFVREYRLHLARLAMDRDGISVSEAAYRAGYSSPANFSTAFKKLFGMTPSQAKR